MWISLYSIYKSFIRYMFLKYFLLICGLFCLFLNSVLQEQKLLILIKSILFLWVALLTSLYMFFSFSVSVKFFFFGELSAEEVKKVSEARSVVSDSLWPHGLYSPWNSPVQNTGVGSLSLFQPRTSISWIFPTQGSNPGLPHCRRILYRLSHKGSPKILGWGSLSLFQWIFPTQESNRGLLHCRQILYQLSYKGRNETLTIKSWGKKEDRDSYFLKRSSY